MRRLIQFFVNNYVLTISVFGALMLFGAVSIVSRGIELFPPITVPVIAVTTSYTGAGPEEVSRQVAQPEEGALTTLSGISSVSSVAFEGYAIVIAQFGTNANIDQAAIDVSQRISQISNQLPDGAGNPTVQKFNPNDQPILSVALSAPGQNLMAVQSYAENTLQQAIERVNGVADVTVVGPAKEQVQILLNPNKLAGYGLTPQQVASAVGASALDVPAGSLDFANSRVLLTARSTPTDLQQVDAIPIDPTRGLTVSDVATVRDTSARPTSYARLNGEPVVLLQVRKLSDSNAVATANGLRAMLAGTKLPPGYHAQIVGDTTAYVASSVYDTLHEMVIAALAVSLVVLLFVGRLGSVFAVVLAIPVALSGALVMFWLFHYTFNIITLLALTVAIGLVVDDAIVVAENIDRYREMGYSRREAVLKGASEISTAVLAATMSLLAVFLPISFLPGIIGQFFAQFGITMAATIAFSYLEAMFFLTVRLALSPDPFPPSWREFPTMAARVRNDLRWGLRFWRSPWFWLIALAAGAGLYRAQGARALALLVLLPLVLVALRMALRVALAVLGALFLNLFHIGDFLVTRTRDAYVATLTRLLPRSWIALTVAGLLFASLFWVFPQIGFNFQPPSDSGQLVIDARLPVGTSLARTNEVATRIEQNLLADPLVKTVQTTVGAGTQIGGTMPEDASLTVQLVGKPQRRQTTNELSVVIQRRLRTLFADHPEVAINVSSADASNAPTTAGYDLTLASTNLTLLRQHAHQAVVVLQNDPQLRNVSSDVASSATERVFVANASALAGTGLTRAQVYQALRTYNVGTRAATMRRNGVEIPIQVMADRRYLTNEQSILSLPLYAPALKGNVTLGSLGHFETRLAPATIRRTNQAYSADVTADPVPGANLSQVKAEAHKRLVAAGVLDAQVVQTTSGNIDLLGDLLKYGPIAFALALLLNYLAIGSQFNSFKYPLYLLLTVPLALIGAVWLFYLTGNSLDIISVLGVVMLVGLVTKNAILLLDVTMQRVAEGGDLRAALIEAARVRFRPIVMTTMTVVVISIPLMVGAAQGAEFRKPLGLVILGGVLTSALLTFFVVPAAFYQFERRRYARLGAAAVPRAFSGHAVEPSGGGVAGGPDTGGLQGPGRSGAGRGHDGLPEPGRAGAQGAGREARPEVRGSRGDAGSS
ncbi:MAG: efflux RND transporter permease subunit [Deinococcales bacterium]